MAAKEAPQANSEGAPRKKDKKSAPIIIKKIKKYEAGHHGGAWKVAFADFMTALMAFFLVMWIVGLNQQTKEMLAAYFRDPGVFEFEKGRGVPVQMGPPPEGSTLPTEEDLQKEGATGYEEQKEGTIDDLDMMPLFFKPDGSLYDSLTREQIVAAVRDSITAANEFIGKVDSLKKELNKLLDESPDLAAFRSSIRLERDPRGIRLELIEESDNMFFEVGSAKLRKPAEQFLRKFGGTIAARLPNSLQIEGHTDSRQYASGSTMSNWDLSAERANTCRRVLQASGLWEGQISAVTGYADRKLRNPDNPYDVSNRRVSILIEQRSHKEFMKTPNAEQRP